MHLVKLLSLIYCAGVAFARKACAIDCTDCHKNSGGKNDGLEVKRTSPGLYVNARVMHDEVVENGDVYEEADPDPALFFPPHLRREFLLDNGARVLFLGRDLETDFNGTWIASAEGLNLIVAELHGLDKSEGLRPSM